MRKSPQIHLIQQCLPNLKIRNQFIIIVAILVMFIVFLIGLCNFTHYTILKSFYIAESNKLFELQTQKRITQMLSLYRDYFYEIFAINGNALISYHRLYHKTRQQVLLHDLEPNPAFQMNYQGVTQIPDPIRVLDQYKANISNSFFCYSNTSAFDNPLSLEEQIGIKLQEQIQAYGQIIYQDSLVMQSNIYSYIDAQKINTIYPCANRGSKIYSYLPPKRNWYIQLKKTYDEAETYDHYALTFTAPYLFFSQQSIGLSMTLPIVNDKLEFVGGVASNFMGAELVQYLSNNQTGFQLIYLVSWEGIMIMHPFKVPVDQLPIYIYNETYTGFNKTDWSEMLSSNSNSSCEHFPQLKCRFNSVTQQVMIVSVANLTQYKMYLVMSLSSDEYMIFTNTFGTTMKDELNSITFRWLSSLIGLFLGLIFLIYIATHILFSPIEIIVQTTKNILKDKKRILLRIPYFISFFLSHEVFQLLKSCSYIYFLVDILSFGKTEQCTKIEEIKYPVTDITLEPFIKYSKNQKQPCLRNQINNQIITKQILSNIIYQFDQNRDKCCQIQ